MEKNIHDKNFKHNFTSTQVAHDFLKHNLPKAVLERVDLATTKIESNEFIPTKYRGSRQSDILYSLKDKEGKEIYALLQLEAQSKHDKDMAIRIWEYHVAIAWMHFKKNHAEIPLILSFVLYNGKAEWTSPKSISDLFLDFDLYCDVALKTPFLINLTKEEFDKLKAQEAAAANFSNSAMRDNGDEGVFTQICEEFGKNVYEF